MCVHTQSIRHACDASTVRMCVCVYGGGRSRARMRPSRKEPRKSRTSQIVDVQLLETGFALSLEVQRIRG